MLPSKKPEVYAPLFHAMGGLWNGPNTLLGLIAGLGGAYTRHTPGRTWEVIGGWLVRLLVRWKLADAITLGDVVLYADPAMPAVLREHEMVHVRQYRAWGLFFLPAYLAESCYQWLRTGDGYRSNRFEVAAYQNSKTK